MLSFPSTDVFRSLLMVTSLEKDCELKRRGYSKWPFLEIHQPQRVQTCALTLARLHEGRRMSRTTRTVNPMRAKNAAAGSFGKRS
jgi:hypothetical protein